MHNPQPLKIVTVLTSRNESERRTRKTIRFAIQESPSAMLHTGRLIGTSIVRLTSYPRQTDQTVHTYFRLSDLPRVIDSNGRPIPQLERQRPAETVFPIGSKVGFRTGRLAIAKGTIGTIVEHSPDCLYPYLVRFANQELAAFYGSELSLVSQPFQPQGFPVYSTVPASTEFPTVDDLLSYSDPLSEFEAFAGGLSLADRAAGCICLPGSYSMECHVHQTRVLNSPQQFISSEGLEARERIAGRNRFAEAFSR